MESRSTCSSGRLTPTQHLESHSRARWTAPLTKVLVDLLLDQVCRGNKRSRSFNKKTWECVCEDFRDKTGVAWDDEQLKSKYSTLRKQYLVVKSLLDHDDFEWIETTGEIVASNEAWDRYTKEHPDSETLRTTGFPMYKQLCTLFSLPSARDRCNQSNGSADHAGDVPSMNPCTQQEESSSSGWEQVSDTADEHKNQDSNVPSRVAGRQKRGRKGVDDAIAKAILEMAAASKLRADAIKTINGKFSISDCVKALDELEGVNDEMYFAALDLFNNRIAREVFLSLKIDKRFTWLSLKRLCPAKTQIG